jgi:Tfp pilus assembly protein PilN
MRLYSRARLLAITAGEKNRPGPLRNSIAAAIKCSRPMAARPTAKISDSPVRRTVRQY